MKLIRRAVLNAGIGMVMAPVLSHGQTVELSRRNTTLVVPFTTGGSADVIARLIGTAMGEKLNQSIVIDNRPGAAGNIGAAFVAKAAADGHTLLLATNNLYGINPALYGKTAQETLAQLQPVIHLAESPLILAVPASSSIRGFRDLVQQARTRSKPFSYGTPGIGTDHHLLGEMIAERVGVPMNHIPYKGASAALSDLGGGQLDVLVTLLATIKPLIDSGKARIIAVTSGEKFGALPDVETVFQTLDGLSMTVSYGLMAPQGTPAEAVAQWNKLARDALQHPAVSVKLRDLGLQITAGTPHAFATRMSRERQERERIIAAANIKLN